MNKMTAKLRTFLREEEGLTTVEYAIAGSLVGLAVVAAFTGLGDAVQQVILDITGAVDGTAATP
jgi:pilus assembly protein Flp/PilA